MFVHDKTLFVSVYINYGALFSVLLTPGTVVWLTVEILQWKLSHHHCDRMQLVSPKKDMTDSYGVVPNSLLPT